MEQRPKTTDTHLHVKVQVFRDMLCLGSVANGSLTLGEHATSWIYLPPGGLQLNSATLLQLNFAHVTPFVNGWYTGMVQLTVDNCLVGQWRPFQLNARNADAPTVAHFSPSAFQIGYSQTHGMEQFVYSLSIQPTNDTWPTLVEGDDEPAFGSHVLDSHGLSWTKLLNGWARTDAGWVGEESIAWHKLVDINGPLRLI
jgi:hypothetical protein